MLRFDEVKRLLDAVADGDEVAFDKIEQIGMESVPALIILMDDRRSYPHDRMYLKNQSKDAFEAYRMYGPELMVDAITAMLNQITGVSFGSIHNGGDDTMRANTIRGWRIYLMTEPTLDEFRK